jgi:hypothetical protein
MAKWAGEILDVKGAFLHGHFHQYMKGFFKATLKGRASDSD